MRLRDPACGLPFDRDPQLASVREHSFGTSRRPARAPPPLENYTNFGFGPHDGTQNILPAADPGAVVARNLAEGRQPRRRAFVSHALTTGAVKRKRICAATRPDSGIAQAPRCWPSETSDAPHATAQWLRRAGLHTTRWPRRSIEHEAARLDHAAAHGTDVGAQAIERCANEHGVVHRSDNRPGAASQRRSPALGDFAESAGWRSRRHGYASRTPYAASRGAWRSRRRRPTSARMYGMSRGARVAGRERRSAAGLSEARDPLPMNILWPCSHKQLSASRPFTQKTRGAAKRACPSLTLIVMRPWRFGRFKPHQTPYQS